MKYIFAKAYTPIWSEEMLVIKEVENIVPWTYVISDVNVEEITATFSGKENQKPNQTDFRVNKAIKGKGDKLHVNAIVVMLQIRKRSCYKDYLNESVKSNNAIQTIEVSYLVKTKFDELEKKKPNLDKYSGLLENLII